MEETLNIPETLASFLAGSGAAAFVPEAWREGAATVRLTGGVREERPYVDGSAWMTVPFEVRLRCAGGAVSARLEAVDIFSRIGRYVRTHAVPIPGGTPGEIRETGGVYKSAVYENGDEEYRAAYVLAYLRAAQKGEDSDGDC